MQQQTSQTPNIFQLMSDFNQYLSPERCPDCGRVHTQQSPPQTVSANDWISQWNEIPVVKEWNRMWNALFQPMMQPMARGVSERQPQSARHRRQRMRSREGRGHESNCCDCACCRQDDCHCRCCVVNADMLVYAHVGESRIIPVTIENHLRREREVELELSEWTTHSKEQVKVTGRVGPETKLTLKPCDDVTVFIAVQTAPETGKPNVPGTGPNVETNNPTGKPKVTASDEATIPPRSQFPDVDECTVFYADLRVKGCDIRSMRIALALLPRDCAPNRIDCQCGCCC